MPVKKSNRKKLPNSPKQRFIRARKGYRITSVTKARGGAYVTEIKPKFPKKKRGKK